MIADPATAQGFSPNWSGSHFVISGGGIRGHSTQQTHGVIPGGNGTGPTGPSGQTGGGDGSYNANGGLIGGGFGYDHQFGSWVAGIETDISYAWASGSSQACGPTLHACGSELKYLGTVRGRFGPTWDRWFAYATGGLAYGRVHAWDAFYGTSGSKTRVGWTAGAGIEAALMSNWSARVEYLYVDLGSGHLYDIVPGVPEHVSFDAHVIRLGISYKLNALAGPR